MNNFAGDPNCIALWRFENGALTADSKGGNTLTAAGTPTADQVNFKEGAASVQMQAATPTDEFSIADASLDAGFPLKSGDALKKISVTFWIRFISLPMSGFCEQIFTKWDSFDYSIAIAAKYPPADNPKMQLWISNDGIVWNEYLHASTLQNGRWYHVGVTYQCSDDAYRIRIWDDTAGAILGVDKTGVAAHVYVANGYVEISNDQAGAKLNALVDEMVIFNDILSVAQIDAIRAGTYGKEAPPIFGGLNKKRVPLAAAQKVGMLAEL